MSRSSIVLMSVLAQSAAMGQAPSTDGSGEWRTYNRDLAGTRYSPLADIDKSNVASLEVAWEYRPAETGGRPSAQTAPIVVGGRMYLTAGNRVVALEPETGKELWTQPLAYSGNTNPISYRGSDGKQYVAIMAAGAAAPRREAVRHSSRSRCRDAWRARRRAQRVAVHSPQNNVGQPCYPSAMTFASRSARFVSGRP